MNLARSKLDTKNMPPAAALSGLGHVDIRRLWGIEPRFLVGWRFHFLIRVRNFLLACWCEPNTAMKFDTDECRGSQSENSQVLSLGLRFFILTFKLQNCIVSVIMNIIADAQLLRSFDAEQRGVFSKADLQTAFGEPHPAAFVRRVNKLLDQKILRRFCRGWYVGEAFDLATLSQRLAPNSYISFGTVLARNLLIGTSPDRQIVAVKTGRPRRYACESYIIEHVGVTEELLFGFSRINGIRYADAEKALLDTFYFHLRGRRYPFDIYSDISLHKLDQERLRDYLNCYRNPKFVTFVQGILEAR